MKEMQHRNFFYKMKFHRTKGEGHNKQHRHNTSTPLLCLAGRKNQHQRNKLEAKIKSFTVVRRG